MFDQLAIQTVRDFAVADGDKIRLTCGQLQRDLYEQVNELFSRFRGQWKGGKVSAHVFPFPITGQVVIDSIVAGSVPPKNPYDLFPTPDAVIDLMLAEVMREFYDQDAEIAFLEPSAGTGAIAKRLRDAYPNVRIDCIEIDPINVRILENQGFTVIHDDFSTYQTDTRYDAVVMNPPFAGTTYIDHIEKAASLTAEHGLTVAIAPKGLVWQKQKRVKQLLASIHERCGVIEELPPKSFKESGTTVDTLLLSIPGNVPAGLPATGYASRRIANLLVMADNDWATYQEKDRLIKSAKSVTVDANGYVADKAFVDKVQELYVGYMDKNPLSYYAILEPWEWAEIAKDIVEEYGIGVASVIEVASIAITDPAPVVKAEKRKAEPLQYEQVSLFT